MVCAESGVPALLPSSLATALENTTASTKPFTTQDIQCSNGIAKFKHCDISALESSSIVVIKECHLVPILEAHDYRQLYDRMAVNEIQ